MEPVYANSPFPPAPAAAVKELSAAAHKSLSHTTSRLPIPGISYPRQRRFYNILLPGASDVAVKYETTHREGSFMDSSSLHPLPKAKDSRVIGWGIQGAGCENKHIRALGRGCVREAEASGTAGLSILPEVHQPGNLRGSSPSPQDISNSRPSLPFPLPDRTVQRQLKPE